jgi:hypothetical protein
VYDRLRDLAPVCGPAVRRAALAAAGTLPAVLLVAVALRRRARGGRSGRD